MFMINWAAMIRNEKELGKMLEWVEMKKVDI